MWDTKEVISAYRKQHSATDVRALMADSGRLGDNGEPTIFMRGVEWL